jgi:hypothetical protein
VTQRAVLTKKRRHLDGAMLAIRQAAMWADNAKWPADTEAARFQITPAVQAFIVKAMAGTKK